MTLNDAICTLREAGIESAEFDARELFIHFGTFKRHDLVSRNASLDDDIIRKPLAERASRKPLQYIIGSVGFYKEVYKVSPDCLIPRQDTEILVDYAVKNIPDGESFIDLCTGSGCVAISTLKNTKNTTALAVELSKAALDVARENARKNGVFERIRFIEADVLNFTPEKSVYAILSNPPYVTKNEYEAFEKELYYEPKMAFVGGEDGLDFYRAIVRLVKNSLNPHGFLAFEIGKDQASALEKIAEENNMKAEIINDLSGHARVAVLKNL